MTKLLTIQAAAELLAVNPKTIRRRIADGSLPAQRLGTLVRVEEADVRALLSPLGGATVTPIRAVR